MESRRPAKKNGGKHKLGNLTVLKIIYAILSIFQDLPDRTVLFTAFGASEKLNCAERVDVINKV